MVRPIEALRKALETDFFTDAELSSILGDGASRHCRTSRLVKEGHIERIKKGLYVFGPVYRRESINTFHLANLLFGPSYVSFESALSHHGLIPEAVFGVASANTRRSERFDTSLGCFQYRKIPQDAFPLGIKRSKEAPHYLIAAPEKALLDKLYLDAPPERLLPFMVESLRLEESDIRDLDGQSLKRLAQSYGNRAFERRVKKLLSELEK